MQLYHLIYTSLPAKKISESELQQLLEVSRQANERFNVTGMLVYLSESFIQLIEGPRLHIEQLYGNIQRDPRHFRVNTLREGVIDQRFFPDWSMAFKVQNAINQPIQILNLQDDKVLDLFNILDQ